MKGTTIYYQDQQSEKEQINNLLSLIEGDSNVSGATSSITGCGFEFPVLEYNGRLLGYKDAVDLLNDLGSKEDELVLK